MVLVDGGAKVMLSVDCDKKLIVHYPPKLNLCHYSLCCVVTTTQLRTIVFQHVPLSHVNHYLKGCNANLVVTILLH